MQKTIQKKGNYMPPMAEQFVLAAELHLLARASSEIDDVTFDGLDGEGNIEG